MPFLQLLRRGQVVDVLFEGLVVLALDLQLGLEFLYQELEAGDLRLELHDVGTRTRRAEAGGSGRNCRLRSERLG